MLSRISPFRRRCGVTLAAASLLAGCDFRGGPEDPTPVVPPTLVNVTIEYRQPNLCMASTRCEDHVAFLASWLPPGHGILLERKAPNVWVGTATGVPVNFPPRDDPHVVAIYDPYLRDTETGGRAAARLQVGGETLNSFLDTGTPSEAAFVYIDENGFGHNPF
jgi:hypothetical protein